MYLKSILAVAKEYEREGKISELKRKLCFCETTKLPGFPGSKPCLALRQSKWTVIGGYSSDELKKDISFYGGIKDTVVRRFLHDEETRELSIY